MESLPTINKPHLIIIFVNAFGVKTNTQQISCLYKQSGRNTSILYIKSKWENEMNIKLTKNDWLNICKTRFNTSSSDNGGNFSGKI